VKNISYISVSKQNNLGKNPLAHIEQAPWSSVYRTIFGFFAVPIFILFCGEHASSKVWVLFFVSILLANRLIPAILRRIFPFSQEIAILWRNQRQIAKRYDSYQWRKLFAVGLGLLAYLCYSGNFRGVHVVTAIACIASGALGLIVWRRRQKQIKSERIGK
jgi:hypothetical protein